MERSYIIRDWQGVLVRMDQLDDADLRDLIEAAWRRAPKKLVKAYDEWR